MVASKVSVASPQDKISHGIAEKPVLSPQLLELTKSLRQWEVPVMSKDVSAEVEDEKRYRPSLESLLHSITIEHPVQVQAPKLSPPPGLVEVRRLCWTIEKAKVMLASSDHSRISPSMEVPLCEGWAPAKFKLMLRPKMSSECRGGACFRRSKGQCFIELKCEQGQDVIGNTKFSFWIGDQPPRGPIEHNFNSDAVGRLPKDLELWDVKKSLGKVPSDPEIWDVKTPVPEGCLVLGVEILVFTPK